MTTRSIFSRSSKPLAGLASLILFAAAACSTTSSYDQADHLGAAKSLTPPPGLGVVVGRVKLELSDKKFFHARDGVLLTSSYGNSYRVRADPEGWFCVWLPAGRYECESLVAFLGQPDQPVVGACPRNEFEVADQEVGYLGTLDAVTRLVYADIGFDMRIEVAYLRVLDEQADASRELAKRYGTPSPPLRSALLELAGP